MSIRKDLSNERYSHSAVTLNHDRNIIDTESTGSESQTLATPPGGTGIWYRLKAEIDPNHSTAPLAAFSFMTGFMYVFFLRFFWLELPFYVLFFF